MRFNERKKVVINFEKEDYDNAKIIADLLGFNFNEFCRRAINEIVEIENKRLIEYNQ